MNKTIMEKVKTNIDKWEHFVWLCLHAKENWAMVLRDESWCEIKL